MQTMVAMSIALLGAALAVISFSPVRAGEPAWEIIEPHFHVPEEFAPEQGEYRSVLTFDNGTFVETAQDWQHRRAEIRDFWISELGPWPELITEPRVEVLSEEQRDGVTWKRVRIEYAPGQTPEAWLLIPEGEGPFPAVLVVSDYERTATIPTFSAIRVFETWISAHDRAGKHTLMNLETGSIRPRMAFIDYAYSMTHKWDSPNHGDTGRPWSPLQTDDAAVAKFVEKIEGIDAALIKTLVTRVPESYLSAQKRDIILQNLLARRERLREMLAA